MRARRNVRDYERLLQHSEAHITWVAITLMTGLAPVPDSGARDASRVTNVGIFTPAAAPGPQTRGRRLEHVLAQTRTSSRAVTRDPELDDLDALRQWIIRQIVFSAQHPQLLRILSHEGALNSSRVRFIVERLVNPPRLEA